MGRTEPRWLLFAAQTAAVVPVIYTALSASDYSRLLAPWSGLVAVLGLWGLLSISFRDRVLRPQAVALEGLLGGPDKPGPLRVRGSPDRAEPPATLASPPGGAGPYAGIAGERSPVGVRPTGAAAGRSGCDPEVRQ